MEKTLSEEEKQRINVLLEKHQTKRRNPGKGNGSTPVKKEKRSVLKLKWHQVQ